MRVGFDISQIAHGGGVAEYTKELTKALVTHTDIDFVFFYASLRKPYQGNLPNVRSVSLPPTIFEALFNYLRLPAIETFLGPIDVFHSSNWVQPPTKAKKVTTIHDLVPLTHPEWSHPRITRVTKKHLSLVEKEIDRVIAVSEATKHAILSLCSIPEDKITVIYEGVSPKFSPDLKLDTTRMHQIKEKYHLPEKYLFSVGTLQPRKNLPRLMSAYSSLESSMPLFIAGQAGWGPDVKPIDNVSLLGFVDGADLPYLYARAYAFLYPALYEGFGLPILEAFGCGIPVVTANTSSMPEVGGAVAVYVDPMNEASIAKGIKEVLDWPYDTYQERSRMGIERAKQFSWQKTAEQTIKVYRELVG